MPLKTFAQHENLPSTLILCLWSDKKFLILSVMLLVSEMTYFVSSRA